MTGVIFLVFIFFPCTLFDRHVMHLVYVCETSAASAEFLHARSRKPACVRSWVLTSKRRIRKVKTDAADTTGVKRENRKHCRETTRRGSREDIMNEFFGNFAAF